MQIHGDDAVVGETFVDPKTFNNPKTIGGATGFLPYYLWDITSISWTMDPGTNIHLNWQFNGQFLGLNGTGWFYYKRDFNCHLRANAEDIGSTGFNGVMIGNVTGSSVKGWTIVLEIKKDPDYFNLDDRYATS